MPLVAITLALGSLIPVGMAALGLAAATPPSSAPASLEATAVAFGPASTAGASLTGVMVNWMVATLLYCRPSKTRNVNESAPL